MLDLVPTFHICFTQSVGEDLGSRGLLGSLVKLKVGRTVPLLVSTCALIEVNKMDILTLDSPYEPMRY